MILIGDILCDQCQAHVAAGLGGAWLVKCIDRGRIVPVAWVADRAGAEQIAEALRKLPDGAIAEIRGTEVREVGRVRGHDGEALELAHDADDWDQW